jgi:hypothetical protein
MAPNAIEQGSLKLISNFTPADFKKNPKLLREKSAIVKKATKGGNVYLKIGVCNGNLLGQHRY